MIEQTLVEIMNRKIPNYLLTLPENPTEQDYEKFIETTCENLASHTEFVIFTDLLSRTCKRFDIIAFTYHKHIVANMENSKYWDMFRQLCEETDKEKLKNANDNYTPNAFLLCKLDDEAKKLYEIVDKYNQKNYTSNSIFPLVKD